MNWPAPLIEAVFLERVNRFRARVRLGRCSIAAHVPNSGRLGELLQPGQRVYLMPRPQPNRGRLTRYDLLLVAYAGVLVSIDARLPGKILAEAIAQGRLPQFAPFERLTPEVRLGDSRIDLLLEGDRGRCYVESKSVTLVEQGVALFPDAVTERGRRHVEALFEARKYGHRGAIVFVVQRPDARALAPQDASDPRFGEALRRAVAGGMEAYAYPCQVDLQGVRLHDPIPLLLD